MGADEDLVARLAEGEEAALAELLRRYQTPLSHFIYRQTGGRDVEDLFQETWIRVARSAGRFDPAKRFSTWLFQIAVNLCRDWHRRRPPEPSTTSAPAPVTGTAHVEARIDAARLLATLPELQREVVVLRYYQDLSEEEVARIVGCPKGTVKSRLHNALAQLAALVRRRET